VIPLPIVRALSTAAPTAMDRREQVVVLSLELGSADEGDAEPDPDVESRVHERCIRAVLVVAGRRGASLALAGTSTHPVVEARFVGEGATDRAVYALLEVAEAVVEAQRAGEHRMAIRAGIGVGSVSSTPRGVRITRGSPSRVAERLRERATLGVLLLGGAGAGEAAEDLGAASDAALALDEGAPAVPVWRLAARVSQPME
jgi:hypothetical protein